MSNSYLKMRNVLAVAIGASLLGAIGCNSAPSETSRRLETAASGTADERYAAIDELGEAHESAGKVVPALAGMLDDEDAGVRWRSARALGDFGSEAAGAVGSLRTALEDDDPVVRYHAAVALGKVGDSSPETIDALIDAITHPDGRVARASILALRNLNPDPEQVMDALEHVLASDEHAVVAHALEAVVERGEGAVPVLNAALKRPHTAYLACSAIELIGPDAAGTVPTLVDLIGETKHSQLLIQALLAVASIGPAAESAVPAITPLLDTTTDETVPVAAAYALGRIGAADADADLRGAMSKPNPFLQMVCAWSLSAIHPDDAELRQQAVDKLTAGLKSDDPAIQAAAEKGLELMEPATTTDDSE